MEQLRYLNQDQIDEYLNFLREEERSKATLEKYRRDLMRFYVFLGEDKVVSKQAVIEYKTSLSEQYKLSSANSMIAAINGLLSFAGMDNCRVKSFKNQRRLFREQKRELTTAEYGRLVQTARNCKNRRLELIIQTIGGTGIRISELSSITVEAVREGQVQVVGKGKHRTVFILPKLKKYLMKYCRQRHIRSGAVFITGSGRPIHRSSVWAEMKRLSILAGINPEKVFPHNLRHLFARTCYKKNKDIVYLADILGHSNIETTRIYTISSGIEHQEMLASLKLIV